MNKNGWREEMICISKTTFFYYNSVNMCINNVEIVDNFL